MQKIQNLNYNKNKNLYYNRKNILYEYDEKTRYIWFFSEKNLDLDSNLYNLKKRIKKAS